MAVFNLGAIFQPQYVANATTQLTFSPAAGGGLVVPANYNFQIATCRVSNNSNAPVSLEMWRVPQGSAADTLHIVVPAINIPVATQTFPWMDLTRFWGIILAPGDSIYAVAGTASALTIDADGAVIQI